MATPRKRWVKQPTSILREPWEPEVKLCAVLLSCWLGDRWARDGLTAEEACWARMSRADVAAVTTKHRPDVALKLLQRLANVASISVQRQGEFTLINWPKWSELQNLPAPSPGHREPESRPLQDSYSEEDSVREERPRAPRENDAAEKGEKARKPKKEGGTPYTNAWDAAYEEFRGHRYVWAGKQDFVALGGVQGASGVNLETFKALLPLFHTLEDPWVAEQQGYNVFAFTKRLNVLLEALRKRNGSASVLEPGDAPFKAMNEAFRKRREGRT